MRTGILRKASWAVRAGVLAGLVLFVVGVWRNDPQWPGDLRRAGLAVMTAGCWLLTALECIDRRRLGERGADVALGLVFLAIGVFSLMGATDEGGFHLFVVVVGTLLVLGGLALVIAAAAAKRRSEEWRNTPGDRRE